MLDVLNEMFIKEQLQTKVLGKSIFMFVCCRDQSICIMG